MNADRTDDLEPRNLWSQLVVVKCDVHAAARCHLQARNSSLGSLRERKSNWRREKTTRPCRWTCVLAVCHAPCWRLPLHPRMIFCFTYLTVRDSRSYLTASDGARNAGLLMSKEIWYGRRDFADSEPNATATLARQCASWSCNCTRRFDIRVFQIVCSSVFMEMQQKSLRRFHGLQNNVCEVVKVFLYFCENEKKCSQLHEYCSLYGLWPCRSEKGVS